MILKSFTWSSEEAAKGVETALSTVGPSFGGWCEPRAGRKEKGAAEEAEGRQGSIHHPIEAGATHTMGISSSAVLPPAEEALLSDRQDMSHPDQGVLAASAGHHHPGHAHLQEGRARHRGGEALPQPRARP